MSAKLLSPTFIMCRYCIHGTYIAICIKLYSSISFSFSQGKLVLLASTNFWRVKFPDFLWNPIRDYSTVKGESKVGKVGNRDQHFSRFALSIWKCSCGWSQESEGRLINPSENCQNQVLGWTYSCRICQKKGWKSITKYLCLIKCMPLVVQYNLCASKSIMVMGACIELL